MMDYQLNTPLNGNLAMTSCFHENKALQQDTTLYKFIWVRNGILTVEIDHIPMRLNKTKLPVLRLCIISKLKLWRANTSLFCSIVISTASSAMMTKYRAMVSFFMVLPR